MARVQTSAQRKSQRPQLRGLPRTDYIPPDTSDVEEAEVGKFKPLPGRDLITERTRRVSAEALRSTTTRMRGTPHVAEPEPDPDPDPVLGDFPGAELRKNPEVEPEPYYEPEPVAKPAPQLMARAISVADGDRLWDWIRQDGDGGHTLFGRTVQSSIELHALLRLLTDAEVVGRAIIRTLDVQGVVLGFVTLNPILTTEQTALVTVYLAPDARGQYAALLPLVLDAVATLTPLHLALPGHDADLYRRLLTPLGFREHTLFVR